MRNIDKPWLHDSDFEADFIGVENKIRTYLETHVRINNGYKLRSEYQPRAIAKLLKLAYTDVTTSAKIHIGCGGGKSLIFVTAICLAIIKNEARRIVITAPSIALCHQLQMEFEARWDEFKKAGETKHINLKIFQISSLGIDDADYKAEHADDADLSEIDGQLKAIVTLDRFKIEQSFNDNSPTVYFVCKPSFLNAFIGLVKGNQITIDITCHDEYHNYITQDTNNSNKTSLMQYAEFSKSNWFFSASKRQGTRFSHTDPVFGAVQALEDIKTSKLVEWHYLVPHLRVFFVSSGEVRGISDAIKDYFKGLNIARPSKFFKEAAVILYVMAFQLSLQLPKAIVFGSFVPFLDEMMRNDDFKKKLDDLITGIQIYKLTAKTKRKDCNAILKQLKASTDGIATLLLQHSKVGEGVDVTNLNTALICRGMSDIALQQALGRIQRVRSGKDTAYLYLYIDNDKNNAKEQAKELALHLHYALGADYQWTIEGPISDRTGLTNTTNKVSPNLGDINFKIIKLKTAVTEQLSNNELAIVARKAREEIEEQERNDTSVNELYNDIKTRAAQKKAAW